MFITKSHLHKLDLWYNFPSMTQFYHQWKQMKIRGIQEFCSMRQWTMAAFVLKTYITSPPNVNDSETSYNGWMRGGNTTSDVWSTQTLCYDLRLFLCSFIYKHPKLLMLGRMTAFWKNLSDEYSWYWIPEELTLINLIFIHNLHEFSTKNPVSTQSRYVEI